MVGTDGGAVSSLRSPQNFTHPGVCPCFTFYGHTLKWMGGIKEGHVTGGCVMSRAHELIAQHKTKLLCCRFTVLLYFWTSQNSELSMCFIGLGIQYKKPANVGWWGIYWSKFSNNFVVPRKDDILNVFFLNFLQDTYPMRYKAVNYYNTPTLFNALFEIFKYFMKEKIKKRVSLQFDFRNHALKWRAWLSQTKFQNKIK